MAMNSSGDDIQSMSSGGDDLAAQKGLEKLGYKQELTRVSYPVELQAALQLTRTLSQRRGLAHILFSEHNQLDRSLHYSDLVSQCPWVRSFRSFGAALY